MTLRPVEKKLFFLTLLFLPTQLGLHFWPNFAYVFSLRIDYLAATLYFWDFLVAFLIISWLSSRPKINRIAFNVLFIFLLTQAVSLFSNFSFGVGLVRLEQYIISGLFGLYIASQDFNRIKKNLFVALSISILAESVLAILQFVKGGTIGFWIFGERSFDISTPAIAKFDYEGRQFLRPYATFPHPNVLAGFLVILLPLLNLLKTKKDRKIFFSTSFLLLLVTFLTISRIVIIGAVAESFFLLRKKFLYVLIVVLVLISPILFTRYFALANFDILSLDRREEQIDLSLSIFTKNPLIGVGLNNFITYASVNLAVGPNRFLQPVHNIYLLELAETGLLGFVGFLLLIGYPIIQLNKIKQKNLHANTFLLIYILILFLGTFDHFLLTLPQGYRLLFLIWGLSLSKHQYKVK